MIGVKVVKNVTFLVGYFETQLQIQVRDTLISLTCGAVEDIRLSSNATADGDSFWNIH